MEPTNIFTRGERILYRAIGFFICFFGVYGSFAFYSIFSRAGATHVGPRGVGVSVTLLCCIAIATAFVMFDRSLVAQVHTDLTSFPRTAKDFRNPVGSRKLRLFAGRLLIAAIVSFFAAQAVDFLIFAKDIKSQLVTEARIQTHGELATAEGAAAKAMSAFAESQGKLHNLEMQSFTEYHKARAAQHGACRPKTACATRLRTATRESFEYGHPKSDPGSPKSSYELAVKKLKTELGELRKDPDVIVHEEGPLREVSALYRYLGHKPLGFIFYVPIMIILFAVDLAALLLKYFVAHGNEYELRQAGSQHQRWAEMAERLEREAFRSSEEKNELQVHEEGARREKATLERESVRLANELLRSGYARAATDTDIAAAAADYAWGELADRFGVSSGRSNTSMGTSPTPSMQSAAAVSPEPAASPMGHPPGKASTSEIAVATSRRSLIFEILGGAAGITALMYFMGGIYAYGQLKQARLSTSILEDIPTRTIILHGGVITVLGMCFTVGVGYATEAGVARLQKAVGISGPGLNKPVAVIKLAWHFLREWFRGLLAGRREHVSHRTVRGTDVIKAPEVIGSTVAFTAALSAGELTDGSLTAAIAGATGLGTVVLVVFILAVLGSMQPRTRGFHGLVLASAAIITMAGAYWYALKQPFALPTAEVRLASSGSCLEGSFLSHDDDSAYIIDGTRHSLRVIPMRTISTLAVSSSPQPVVRASIREYRCP